MGKVVKFDPRKRAGPWWRARRSPADDGRRQDWARWKNPDHDSALRRRRWTSRFRRPRWRRLYDTIVVTMALMLAVIGLARHAPESFGRFGPIMGLRHWLAAPNCDAARAVGLAPANRGEPGYWPRHDRDKDGIACEPWPRRY